VSDVFPVLCLGGNVVVGDCFTVKDAGSLERAFEENQVKSYSAVPIIVETLLALNVGFPASLRFGIIGAAPLSERTRIRYLEEKGHPLVPCYGLTESVCFAAASPVGGVKPGSAGKAAGIEICVLGGDYQPLPAEEYGEIALRGPSVITRGYFHEGGERLEVFLEDGWFLTGDMGYLDRDGYLFITGRQKNMVIRGGEKLYLEDLDRCLSEHPGISDACCIQTPGTTDSERAVAFLVPQGPERPADEEIIAWAQESLGFLGRPDELVWVDLIPRSATGKPLRASLRSSYQKDN
jgi:long-chain acyl-CoA synthetase